MKRFEPPQFIYADEPFDNPCDSSSDGLVAVGGNLSATRLLQAYSNGIFPWFNSDSDPVLWWSPNPRTVLRPRKLHVSRSLAKWHKRHQWQVTVDKNFDAVVEKCADTGKDRESTWITPRMKRAYSTLHSLGYAHSLEVWAGLNLAGGIYGVSLGTHFYGESMFSHCTNGSKVALWALCDLLSKWNFELIDCQLYTPHLESLGAEQLPRTEFLKLVDRNRQRVTMKGRWRAEPFQP